jgi:hypothetical protein
MFDNPSLEVICNSSIEHCMILICHDIDVILILFHGLIIFILAMWIFTEKYLMRAYRRLLRRVNYALLAMTPKDVIASKLTSRSEAIFNIVDNSTSHP